MKLSQINSTIAQWIDYMEDRKPIITAYGVMFQRHGTVPNPLYTMIDGFIKGRDSAKKEMFKYPKGSEMFEKWNLNQLLLKIDANGFYGAMGMYTCLFYNIYVAASATTQGRSLNAAMALFFESFLNNNVPMGSLNEVIKFIHDVLSEPYVFDYKEVITNHASIDETFFQIMSSTGFGWVPTEEEMLIVWDILDKLNQEELDRLFYKNNLFNFVDNEPVTRLILHILQTLEKPFLDPNDPPEEIREDLDLFTDILKDFVYYDNQIIDRLEKMTSLIRTVSIIQDTDSAIISLDGWYEYMRKKCFGVPMKIKSLETDAASFAVDGEINTEEAIPAPSEYSFLDDAMIETQALIDPMVIIPQDGLRFSIINIISYSLTLIVNDYMRKYCDNSNTTNDRPCLIRLKNEFLMRRVLTTDAKKNYASKLELQEGHMVPDSMEKSLDIKGMDAFVKSTTNPAIQKKLKKVMYEDVVNAREDVNVFKVLKDLSAIEKDIYDSIQRGEKIFFKPLKVKSVSSYSNPMLMQGVVASYVYNSLHQPGTESLDTNVRNSVDIAKVDMNPRNIERIREAFPDVYEKAIELFKNKKFSGGITSVAIPLTEPVPKWVLPFIDYNSIINDNLSGFPIESLGINRGAKTNNTTNMINFASCN